MGGDFGSWPHPWLLGGQPLDFNSIGAWTLPFLGFHSHLSNHFEPHAGAIDTDKKFSVSAEPSQSLISYSEPDGWFYCLPSFRQTMFPHVDSFYKKHLFLEPQASNEKDAASNADSIPQKQFLVFDQIGDQTTMIFSSAVGTSPVRCLSHWTQREADASLFHLELEGGNEPAIDNSRTVLLDINMSDEDHESYVQSEMHEDTEELNALMYSDGDTESVDDEDEVTSTGHSPSALTDNEKQFEFAVIKEEVASSDEMPNKRQKLFHGENMVGEIGGRITLNHSGFSFDEDTESHCGNCKVCDSSKTTSFFCKNRTRKDLVQETICTLQGIIPGGKGGTPIEVIDEAIKFLISLKLKVNSLGLEKM